MFHILVADDDQSTRRLFKAVLEDAGYRVSLAENGAKALAVMEKEVIDLVVLDIMMPEMDGYRFTQILREVNNNLPFILRRHPCRHHENGQIVIDFPQNLREAVAVHFRHHNI